MGLHYAMRITLPQRLFRFVQIIMDAAGQSLPETSAVIVSIACQIHCRLHSSFTAARSRLPARGNSFDLVQSPPVALHVHVEVVFRPMIG